MASLAAHVFTPPKAPITSPASVSSSKTPRLRSHRNDSPHRLLSFLSPSASDAAAGPIATDSHPLATAAATSTSLSNWVEFARRVSGEWDGFGVEFTSQGAPVELPENVVPGAFREWGVQVFDWQTQCPTLADEHGGLFLTYKMIKLLPTVGCEADAATRYSVEERAVGGADNQVSAFAYDSSGSFVAVWPMESRGGLKVLELEHCLVDPRDKEARIRVIQVVLVEEGAMRLEKIRVFSEHWDGPFRNGELLGGCAIRDSAFATTAVVDVSEVVGVWQGTSLATARLQSEHKGIFHELVVDMPFRTIRELHGLVALPKQLWSLSGENKDGETWWEVGWLLDHGNAITSRCVFLNNGMLKASCSLARFLMQICLLSGMRCAITI
ncbi:hypothetical protein MUK42_18191 [Musa troglodytarum]|uniref:Uncharacterized protein n=1 Tax=Musa troglodytarum TaxID=320322 RepID=A0A9E7HD18_9LILI|nr:hypothetical protein MUK42_18191 [Musa troglodytarum]